MTLTTPKVSGAGSNLKAAPSWRHCVVGL